jgi:hypothetical protein
VAQPPSVVAFLAFLETEIEVGKMLEAKHKAKS